MANVRELVEIAKENQKLVKDIYTTVKTGLEANATSQQVDDFKSLVERIRTEIVASKSQPVTDENGMAAPALRKQVVQESLKAVQEAKKVEGLSEGALAELEAREASLGIQLAFSTFSEMKSFGELLTNNEWDELTKNFEAAAKDLDRRKKAKAFLDASVTLAILIAKVASQL